MKKKNKKNGVKVLIVSLYNNPILKHCSYPPSTYCIKILLFMHVFIHVFCLLRLGLLEPCLTNYSNY